MRLLLDSHVLIWWWAEDRKRLGKAIKYLLSPMDDIFVSSASAWEIATKYRLGKLDPGRAIDQFEESLALDGFVPLPVDMNHALKAGSYDNGHQDPFDRMLAAQAELEGMTLLTRDPAFQAFPCETVWE